MMVNGTKEKNSAVRCASEEALTALFALRKDQNAYTVCTFIYRNTFVICTF